MEIISFAIFKLAVIAAVGFYLYTKTIIDDKTAKMLESFVVNYTAPFLFFTQLIEKTDLVLSQSVFKFFALSFIIFLTGYALSYIFLLRRNNSVKKEYISLVSFQNAGYLPMSMAIFFSSAVKEEFLIFVIMYLLGFNFFMWSLSGVFIFNKPGQKFNFTALFNPAVMGIICGLFFVYTGWGKSIPFILLEPFKMIGETTFVLSMIILGCCLAQVKLQGIFTRAKLIIEICLLKLVIIPLIFLFLVIYFKVYSLFGLLIVVQAAMPTATSLSIIGGNYNADSRFIAQAIFVTHILCVVTVPVWLNLFLKFSRLIV
jgi:hypothetical protein